LIIHRGDSSAMLAVHNTRVPPCVISTLPGAFVGYGSIVFVAISRLTGRSRLHRSVPLKRLTQAFRVGLPGSMNARPVP